MANKRKLISVLGGNGFLGSYLVNSLLSKGYYVKVISRSAKVSRKNFITFKPGQCSLINCDIKNYEELRSLLAGSDYVINLVGLLVSKKNNSFYDIHCLALKNLVKVCKNLNILKLIHISAIGANKKSKSDYAKTKYLGEEEVQKYNQYCILRPSIIVGDEDNFINFFAKTAKLSPFLPLIGGGKTLFQPIWVQDVADIIIKVLESNIHSKTLEVGGEEALSFKDILELILDELQIKRKLIPIPFSISKQMAFFLERLPKSLLTRDQVELLKTDNIIKPENDYRKYINHSPLPLRKILKKQLSFMGGKGGHLD